MYIYIIFSVLSFIIFEIIKFKKRKILTRDDFDIRFVILIIYFYIELMFGFAFIIS